MTDTTDAAPKLTDRSRPLAALALLTLGACAAPSFSLGAGATTSTSASTGAGTSAGTSSGTTPAGYTSPTGLVPGDHSERPIDPDDEITLGTDRANARTPNNAGRARTYPVGYDDGLRWQAYGPNGAARGDGYFVSNRHRWAILAGYTVEEATRRAKLTGFVGRIQVSPMTEYDAHCGEGMVCAVQPQWWQSSLDDYLILYVNRDVKISSPD